MLVRVELGGIRRGGGRCRIPGGAGQDSGPVPYPWRGRRRSAGRDPSRWRAVRGAAEGYLLGSAPAGCLGGTRRSRLVLRGHPSPSPLPQREPGSANPEAWAWGGDTAECPRRTSARPRPPGRDTPARAEPRRHSGGTPPHTALSPPRENPATPAGAAPGTRGAEEILRRGAAPHCAAPAPRKPATPAGAALARAEPRRYSGGGRRPTLRCPPPRGNPATPAGAAWHARSRGDTPAGHRPRESLPPPAGAAWHGGSRGDTPAGGTAPHRSDSAPRWSGYRREAGPYAPGREDRSPPNGSGSGRRAGLYAGFCHPVTSRSPGRRPSI